MQKTVGGRRVILRWDDRREGCSIVSKVANASKRNAGKNPSFGEVKCLQAHPEPSGGRAQRLNPECRARIRAIAEIAVPYASEVTSLWLAIAMLPT
jgi:hypothetical protein